MEVDRRTKCRECHRAALSVPSGASFSPWARPCRLVADRSLPYRCVERIVLVGIVRVSAVLSREPDRSFPVETNGGRDISATKVDRTIALVGRPVRDQLLCERDDLVDVVTAAGFETGSSNAQGRHVALEPISLLCCQRPPRFAITGGLNKKMVVDVSHVPTHVDCCSSQSQNRAATSAHTNVAAWPT